MRPAYPSNSGACSEVIGTLALQARHLRAKLAGAINASAECGRRWL
jgi:hypothetical protein